MWLGDQYFNPSGFFFVRKLRSISEQGLPATAPHDHLGLVHVVFCDAPNSLVLIAYLPVPPACRMLPTDIVYCMLQSIDVLV